MQRRVELLQQKDLSGLGQFKQPPCLSVLVTLGTCMSLDPVLHIYVARAYYFIDKIYGVCSASQGAPFPPGAVHPRRNQEPRK